MREERARQHLGVFGMVLCLAVFFGCGGKTAPPTIAQYYGDYHPAGWMTTHGGQAVAGIDACMKCHEISVLKVGSAVPTCLTSGCHHQGTPGFADPAIHGLRAKLINTAQVGGGLVACQLCHGKDFAGGPSTKACATCHVVSAPHPPKPWRIAVGSAWTHVTTDPSNAVVCAQCHYPGSPNNPAAHPATPAPAGTQPGCFNATLCHGEHAAPHPVPFLAGATDSNLNGHMTVTAAAFAVDCASCHAYTGTSPTTSAPLCEVCHQLADPTLPGTNAGTCLSCHIGPSGLPKGPGGTGFPSIAGAHAKHMNLATGLTCSTCHAGSGSGTATHYANANARFFDPVGPASVSLDPLYTAKTGGAPAFTGTSLTCSNVSCHGGQTTPSWVVGAINSATQCTSCHGVAASATTAVQYNDAFGRHSLGTHNATSLSNGIGCTTCHNMGNGSPGALAHFKYLNTTAVDGTSGTPSDQLPSGTITFDPLIVSAPGTYAVTSSTQGSGTCALTCHSHIHLATVNDWTFANVPHPVPFLAGQKDVQGNGHLTTTAAIFAADCANCHAYSGASPNAPSPLCSICHALANPTLVATGAGTCLSCHTGPAGLPAGPAGTAFPSVPGAHAKHLALPTPLTCNTCHASAGAGTATHYTNANARTATPTGPATVSIDPTYKAKPGANPAFVPDALTCSNVSCHGGQATPAWQGGTLSSSTQCTACHGVATSALTASQYNDAFGRHSLGTHNATNAANAIACTTCHNMGNGSPGALAHFKYLNTTAVDAVATGTPTDQMPSGTIVFNPAIVTGAGTYTVTSATQGNGGCALTCHTHVHTAAVDDWTSIGVPHPIPFLTGQTDAQGNGHLNASAASFTADCSNCHAYTGTSPVATAPLCSICHTLANPTVVATGTGTCLSCHVGTSGLPKGPGGTGFPSIPGAHVKHMNLPTALTCDTCHTGAGSGTATHYANANARTGTPTGPATVSIDLLYTAKTGGNPSFVGSTLTCSNVSCHGGQATPGWQVGTLNSSTQCTACHGVAASAGTITQYNDAFGRHSLGTHNATTAANGIACTTCHNMGNGSQGALAHFKYLNTGAVDGVATGVPADQLPSGTIVFDPVIVTAGTYTVTGVTQGNGGCALTCHSHIHTASFDTWTASGAPHPVPFYSGQTDTQGNSHLTLTPAAFTADCASCHAYSGTSPLAGAPLCSVCHTLADPTQVATGVGTCLSCHVGTTGLPAGPSGVSFPSIAGAHIKHMSLLTPLTCNTCHASAGAGTTTHYNNANARVTTPTGPATVSIDATYHAQSGNTAAFNASSLTCSSTSCHGGLDTPNWQTGTITSTTQCTLCHAINYGTTPSQYNDAIGRHAWGTHSTAGTLACTICHDMTQATPGALNHFAELNTTAVSSTNKLPSTTIKFSLTNPTYPITGAATYTINATYPEGDGGCALTCHSQVHTPTTNHWNMPKGSGVAHPVPFLSTDLSTGGNHHQTLTLAQFNGECTTCHDLTGSASAKTGPTCNVCHTLGDPTAVATGAGTCLSCHLGANFKTKGPTGVSWPNLQGAHPKHLALLTFTRGTPALPASMTASVCEACHVGSVPGDTANTHYSNANKRLTTPILSGPASVSIDPTFNAQSGTAGITASASAFTCSNVSCHGGQTTPGWQAGTNPVNATTYCIACHKVASTATQYNDATGRHNNPGAHNQTCDYCHDMTQAKPGAQDHFKYLDTSAVRITPDQLSSDTILFGSSVTGAKTYTPTGTLGRGGCALTCHGQSHSTSGNVWN